MSLQGIVSPANDQKLYNITAASYIFRSSGFTMTLNTPSLTGNRIINFPDQSGTIGFGSGGNPFNQNLNTTDSVSFSSLETNTLKLDNGGQTLIHSQPTLSTINLHFPTSDGTLALLTDLPPTFDQSLNTTNSVSFQSVNSTSTYKLATSDILHADGTDNLFVGIAAAPIPSTSSIANTACGAKALQSMNNGVVDNTAIGSSAMRLATTGTQNTAVGSAALSALTTGIRNTAIGRLAGAGYTASESNNISLGYNVMGNSGESNITRIGTTQTDCYLAGNINASGNSLSLSNGTNNSIVQLPTLTSNPILTLPSTTGTIALLSDIKSTYITVGPIGSNADFIGSDQTPIQAAIDLATARSAGATVFILAGTYVITAKLILKPKASILGEVYAGIILQAATSLDIIMDSSTQLVASTVQNLTFNGDTTTSHFRWSASGSTIQNCQFQNGSLTPIGLDMVDTGTPTQFNIIESCSFTEFNSNYIRVSVFNWNAKISNCFFSQNNPATPIAINCLGFSTNIIDGYFIGVATAIYCNLNTIITNCIFANNTTGINFDASVVPAVPITQSLLIINAYGLSFGSYVDFINYTATIGIPSTVLLNGINIDDSIATLSGHYLNLLGTGIHNIKATVGNAWTSNLVAGTISTDSYITFPNVARAVEPTPVVLGTLYLDDGTHTTTGNPCFRRYDGTTWKEVADGINIFDQSLNTTNNVVFNSVHSGQFRSDSFATAAGSALLDKTNLYLQNIASVQPTIQFQSNNITYVSTIKQSSLTANRSLFFPDADGILALTTNNPFNQSLNTSDSPTFANVNSTSTYKLNTDTLIHTEGTANLFVGVLATTASNPTSIANTSIGAKALQFMNDGCTDNTAVGSSTARNITTGIQNTAIGSGALSALLTGAQNTSIGRLAGAAYATSESNNISIGSGVQGTIGESNITRIGLAQTDCFISGNIRTPNNIYETASGNDFILSNITQPFGTSSSTSYLPQRTGILAQVNQIIAPMVVMPTASITATSSRQNIGYFAYGGFGNIGSQNSQIFSVAKVASIQTGGTGVAGIGFWDETNGVGLSALLPLSGISGTIDSLAPINAPLNSALISCYILVITGIPIITVQCVSLYM